MKHTTLIIAGALLFCMLLALPTFAQAQYREEVVIGEDNYYSCTAYNGNAKIYTVTHGLCVDHQSVVSDNNHILEDGSKEIDHAEHLGFKKTRKTFAPIVRIKRERIKSMHNARQNKISIMREYNRLKRLLNNL